MIQTGKAGAKLCIPWGTGIWLKKQKTKSFQTWFFVVREAGVEPACVLANRLRHKKYEA